MRRIKLFLPLLIFIALGAMLYWALGRDPNAMPSALLQRPVPEFTLPSLDDAEVLLDRDIFKGKVTILNVWATWCYACRVEHPFLSELAARGVSIIGLNYKDDPFEARTWLKDYGDPYQQTIVDKYGILGIDLGVFGAPESYLIDPAGIIVYKHVGVLDERVWKKDIAPLYDALHMAVDVPPS
jgi:cytochrome c biogenesis protein CcmG, thiol:disulfide interchange protein DsbE